jgi:hypothetical protein
MNRADGLKEIYEVLNKHQDLLHIAKGLDTRKLVENAIKIEKLTEKLGVDIGLIYLYDTQNYIGIDWHRFISKFGERARNVGAPDDNKKCVKNQWLYCIQVKPDTTLFESEISTDLFDRFFNELKDYGPDYVSTFNSALYFAKGNMQPVHDAYDDIVSKYTILAKEESVINEIAKLEAQLSKIKNKKHD